MNLSTLWSGRKDSKILKAAKRGDRAAQWKLTLCYRDGVNVAQDLKEAFSWCEKAARQGHANAQCQLGCFYESGSGVGKDEVRAVEWFRKAADQGHAAAQCSLAWCYNGGKGVSKDEGLAVEWFKKAADQGDATAQKNLGVYYHYGMGVGKDEARDAEWFKEAADQGDAGAQTNLGVCYLHGKGVGKDEALAVQWFKKAADQGHGRAQGNLAEMSAEGLGGLPQDWVAAAKLFESASKEPDSLSAKLCLAWLLWTGRGVDQDVARAASLCAQVRNRDSHGELLAQSFALGPFWPTVLDWFYGTMTTPKAGAPQVASEPQPDNKSTIPNAGPLHPSSNPEPPTSCEAGTPQLAFESPPDSTTATPEAGPPHVLPEPHLELLKGLRDHLAQLETQGGSSDNVSLTHTQRKYLGRVLGREGNLEAIEDKRRDILKDPCTRRYYHALQQSLCWVFVGAQACKSGLVKKQHDFLTRGLIQASSNIAGLLPVYGHLANGMVKTAAQEVADFFAGKNAERIARAGGTDGALVSEGVARYLVFARKGELSSVPRDAYEKAVSKVVKADVEKMMKWVKSESDLNAIREESDITGEKVVHRLVVAAEPSWAQTIRLAAAPGPAVASQSPGGSASVGGAPDPMENVDAEAFRRCLRELDEVKEQLRKMKATVPTVSTEALEVDAGGGQAFVQVRAQESAAGGASRADTLSFQQDFAELCVVVDELKGRVDFYERRGFRAS